MHALKLRDFLNKGDTYSLRGLCMLMIIIGHTYNGYPSDSPGYNFPVWLHFLHFDYWGSIGVAVFLFLSGYGMFFSLQSNRVDKLYMLSKARRLFQPFVIYWAVELLTLLLLNRQALSPHIIVEICTFSIHPDIENWFFKVIAGLYVVIIVLFRLKLNNGRRIGLLTALCVAYIFVMHFFGYGHWWYNTVLCFPLGMLVACNRQWFASRNVLIIVLSSFTAATAFILTRNSNLFHLSLVLLVSYMLRFVDIRHGLLDYIGRNSFIFYFLENPVMDHIAIPFYHDFPDYCVMTMIITFFLSWICIRLTDKRS